MNSSQAIFGLAVELCGNLIKWAWSMGVALSSKKCECHDSACIRPWVGLMNTIFLACRQDYLRFYM